MKKEYFIETKEIRYLPFDAWMSKIEMSAFGWTHKGWHSEETDTYDVDIDWSKKEAAVSQRYENSIIFKRIKPYTSNILFKLTEFMMRIHSCIRRTLFYLLWFLCALGIVIGVISSLSYGYVTKELSLGLTMLAIIYLPSIFYSILGFVLRLLFGIDRKLKRSLRRNGYDENQKI